MRFGRNYRVIEKDIYSYNIVDEDMNGGIIRETQEAHKGSSTSEPDTAATDKVKNSLEEATPLSGQQRRKTGNRVLPPVEDCKSAFSGTKTNPPNPCFFCLADIPALNYYCIMAIRFLHKSQTTSHITIPVAVKMHLFRNQIGLLSSAKHMKSHQFVPDWLGENILRYDRKTLDSILCTHSNKEDFGVLVSA